MALFLSIQTRMQVRREGQYRSILSTARTIVQVSWWIRPAVIYDCAQSFPCLAGLGLCVTNETDVSFLRRIEVL